MQRKNPRKTWRYLELHMRAWNQSALGTQLAVAADDSVSGDAKDRSETSTGGPPDH